MLAENDEFELASILVQFIAYFIETTFKTYYESLFASNYMDLRPQKVFIKFDLSNTTFLL